MANSLDKLTYMEETHEEGGPPQGSTLQKYLSQLSIRATDKHLAQEGSRMEEGEAMGLPPAWIPPNSEEWLSSLSGKIKQDWIRRVNDFGESCKADWTIWEWLLMLELPEQNNMEACRYKLKAYKTIMSVPADYIPWHIEYLQLHYLYDWDLFHSHQDEFVRAMEYLLQDLLDRRNHELFSTEDEQEEYFKESWFGFLRQRIRDLENIIKYHLENHPGLKNHSIIEDPEKEITLENNTSVSINKDENMDTVDTVNKDRNIDTVDTTTVPKLKDSQSKNDPPSGQRSLDVCLKSPTNLQSAPFRSYSIDQQNSKDIMKFDSNQASSDLCTQVNNPHDTNRHSIEENTIVDETQGVISSTTDDLKIKQEEIHPTADNLKIKHEETSSTAVNFEPGSIEHNAIKDFECQKLKESKNSPNVKKEKGLDLVITYDIPNFNLSQCRHNTALNPSSKQNTTSVHGHIIYPCDLCEYKSTHKSSLKLHTEGVHGRTSYTCDQCNYEGTQKQYLKRHIKSVHRTITYNCAQCYYKATMKSNFKQQLKPSNENPYEGIQKVISKQTIASAHEHINYTCDLCKHKSAQKSSLRMHIEEVHGRTSYTCDQCNYEGTQKQYLKQHMKSVHRTITYSCAQCDYKASMKSNVKQQLKSSNENPYEGIQKVISNQTIASATKQINYSCDLCEHKSAQKSSLKMHIEDVHGRTSYTCDQCNYEGTQKQYLKRHIKSVHRTITYTGAQCDYKATMKSNFKQQIKSGHENVKHYILANYSTISSSNMHQNQDLFFKECPNCVFSTDSFGQYYAHASKNSYQKQGVVSIYPNYELGTLPFGQYYTHESMSSYLKQSLALNCPNYTLGKNWPSRTMLKAHILVHTVANSKRQSQF